MVIQSILLVAGDASTCRLVAETLAPPEYRLQIVPGLREALELAPPVDVALIDVPSSELAAACDELRCARGASMAIVATVDDLDSADEALRAGADDVLQKSIRPGELLLRVRAVLSRRRARRADGDRHDVITLFVHDLKSPLGAVMLNAAMLALTSWLAGQLDLGFHVDGFWPAVGGALVITVVTRVVDSLIGPENRR